MDALTFGVALLLCALEAALAGLACRRATVAAELVRQIETNRVLKPAANVPVPRTAPHFTRPYAREAETILGTAGSARTQR
jgi:hypothetical protein